MTDTPPLTTEGRPWRTSEVADWCREEIATIGEHVAVNKMDERMAYVQLTLLGGMFTELIALHRTMARLLHLAERNTTPTPPTQTRTGW